MVDGDAEDTSQCPPGLGGILTGRLLVTESAWFWPEEIVLRQVTFCALRGKRSIPMQSGSSLVTGGGMGPEFLLPLHRHLQVGAPVVTSTEVASGLLPASATPMRGTWGALKHVLLRLQPNSINSGSPRLQSHLQSSQLILSSNWEPRTMTCNQRCLLPSIFRLGHQPLPLPHPASWLCDPEHVG